VLLCRPNNLYYNIEYYDILVLTQPDFLVFSLAAGYMNVSWPCFCRLGSGTRTFFI